MGIELALIGLNIGFFAAQVLAWRWARGVQHDLIGGVGYELARIVALIIGWTLVGRVAGIVIIGLVGVDPGNLDSALALTLGTQIGVGILYVWVAVAIGRLRYDDSDIDTAHPEADQLLEGVGVQVDEVGPDGAVAVDDGDPDAALGANLNALTP